MSISKDQLNMIAQTFHYSRKLLVNPSPTSQPIPANFRGGESSATGGESTFDANVVMVLSVLLCALICSLGLNSIVRCALRCSSAVTARNTPDRRSNAAVTTGVKKKALRMFPTVVYTSSEKLGIPGLDGDCAICLSEFVAGDKLRLLPKCCHGFHVKCIDTWLNSHSSCPKCRHNLLETCHKIVGTSANFPASTPAETTVDISPPPVEAAVDILPLEHEGPVRSYRGDRLTVIS